MRRRTKRELSLLLTIAIVAVGIILVNGVYQRGSLSAFYEQKRIEAEGARKTEGIELLDWRLMRSTKGRHASGPTFTEELAEKHGYKYAEGFRRHTFGMGPPQQRRSS